MIVRGFLGLAVVGLTACALAQAACTEDLPLRAGTAWVYKGAATDGDGAHAVTQTVRVVESDGRVARVAVNGATHLVEWRGAVLRVDDGPVLEWPPARGTRTCSEPGICWEVEAADSVTLDARGVPPGAHAR